jgi:O-acetyl-ADP-ribose deacetylase (regulator of RNase III)
MFAEYKRRCAEGQFKLGDVFAWSEGGVTVFNLGTQKTWRTKADLSAIETALRTMVGCAERAGIGKVGLPRIGAGLGGLPWASVRDMLRRTGDETDVELVVFEEYESEKRQ